MNQEVLIKNKEKKEKLNIVYALSWAGVCGGTKISLEQANRLSQRGHNVTIVCKDEKPQWFPIDKKVKYIQVKEPNTYGSLIPKNTDVIVCARVFDVVEKKIAPVVFFEQGDNHLFNRKLVDENRLIRKDNDYFQCNNVLTVSKFAKSKIRKYYKKNAYIIKNAVDDKVFYYEKHKSNDEISITAIGREDWEFKGLKYIIKAVKNLEKRYKIKFNWITQTMPDTQIGNIIVNPKQMVIGDILRNTDIYICASQYESFCLPVLEAMTCGAAVITTDNGGNREFAINEETCLKVRKKSSKDIEEKVERLIKDKELRKRLVKNGLKVASQYNWDDVISELEEYLREIATYSVTQSEDSRKECLFISGGESCRPTYYLKKYNLRYQAYPLDWQICSLKSAIHLYETKFNDFFKEYKDYPEKLIKSTKMRYVRDTKNDIISMHHISSDKPIDEAVKDFVELMQKRYADLDESIKNHKRIIILGNHQVDVSQIKSFVERLSKIYKGKEFLFVNIHKTKGNAFSHTITRLNDELKIIEFCFNDINKKGNDPEKNLDFWKGNEEKWDKVMKYILENELK